MKSLLAKKQNEDQKKGNDFAKYHFILAMMNLDEKVLENFLIDDVKYLGYMNKWQFLYYLKQKFTKIDPHMYQVRHNESISMDIYPGCEVFEFSYVSGETLSLDDFFSTEQKEIDIFKSKNAITLKFVLFFENGKISDIRIPKKNIDMKKIKQFLIDN